MTDDTEGRIRAAERYLAKAKNALGGVEAPEETETPAESESKPDGPLEVHELGPALIQALTNKYNPTKDETR